MQAELARMNQIWAAVAAAAGEKAPEVRIGVGLNTGACCVGNVGSPERLNYSVLGDAVNIAARLEEATKSYAVPIIAGERTAGKAQGFAFLEIGTATLRGKDTPERLFALVGDETLAASGRFRELAHCHAALAAAVRSNDRAKIAPALAACRALGWPELEGLFSHYEKRVPAGV
jgi:adenylate cyclase